ncbi:MAG: T9SS type A sorting domain-containing protein [Cyclobacteriaceae bacterium]
MKTTITKCALCLSILFMWAMTVQAQENSQKVKVEISKEIDGEMKTFKGEYDSEEAMKADKDLREFMGDDATFWTSKSGSGSSFFKFFGDDGNYSFDFDSEEFSNHFKHLGDSMNRFDFSQLEDLDEELKEHLDKLQSGNGFAFSFGGDDQTFEWHSLEGLGEEIAEKMEQIFEEGGENKFETIIIKKIQISEDASEFGKKAVVKPSHELILDDLSYYPNPATNGRFRLKFTPVKDEELSIKIYNIEGQEVFNRYFNRFSGLYSEKIDLTQQEEGIYLLEIENGDKRLTRKIVID